jgi:hypothetical protein
LFCEMPRHRKAHGAETDECQLHEERHSSEKRRN